MHPMAAGISPSGLDLFRQNLFVPAATLTSQEAPDQTGKVHIVTGGYSGCGYEFASLLFSLNAVVYIAGRNPDKAHTAAFNTHPLKSACLDHQKNERGILRYFTHSFGEGQLRLLANLSPQEDDGFIKGLGCP